MDTNSKTSIVMKKLFFNIFLALTLICGGVLNGCKGVAEEITSLDLTRCLEPLNLSNTIFNGDSVVFDWDIVSGSDQYALQISTDSTFDKVDREVVVPSTDVPCGVKLVADQKYFFRVQSQVSDESKEFSKWAVYDGSVKTYAVRSNLNLTVTERTVNSLSVSWDKDPDVTHISYTNYATGEELQYDLQEADIENATATVTGLAASTNYVVGLYYLSANRGELNLYTMPDLNGVAEASTTEALAQALKDGATAVKLTMAGSPYELGAADLSSPIKIYGEESAEGGRPVIKGELHIVESFSGSFYSEGVEWNGNSSEFGFPIQLKNGGKGANVPVTEITYKNCTITGYSKGLIYEWGQTFDLGYLTYDGCTIHSIPGSGGDGIDFRNASAIDAIVLKNSTVYNSFRTFFRIDANVQLTAIELNNNTIMNVAQVDDTNNGGLFGIQSETVKATVKNNVFLHMASVSTMISANTKYRKAGDFISFSGNFYFDVPETFFNDNCSQSEAVSGGGSVLTVDPCYNSAGLIFNLTNPTVIASKAGDPRWQVAYVEPPIDNELTLLAGAKTWDLSDASIFNGTMKVTQVKDQLRFIVSESNTIVLEESLVKFTNAANVGRTGVPSDGALEFRVNKPGSVYLKTADYDDNTGNHIVVSVDGVVKGGVATNTNMGNVQKILVTDIAEGEEVSVYLYPSGPIAIETLAWSLDTAQVNTALATPEPVLEPASMLQGNATDIKVTWAPVENAGSYSVSFNNGAAETVTEAAYTIPASMTGFLQGGGYAVKVWANPAEGDVYNTQSSAGSASLTVLPSGGTGGGTEVSTADELFNALGAGVDEIILKAGTYDFTTATATGLDNGIYTVSGDLKLSSKENATVIGSFKLGAGAKEIEFDGIVFDGNNQAMGNLFEDLDGATNMERLTVKNSTVTGYQKSIIYVNQTSSYIGNVEFSSVLVYGMGTGQGTFDMRNGSVGSLSVENCTVYDGSRDIFRVDANVSGMSALNITNNTFANITGGNSNGFARIRAAVSGGVTISKNLFLNTPAGDYPFVHSNTVSTNTVNVSDNYFFNPGEKWFSDMDEATATANGGAVLTADPVANSAAGDFTLTNAVLMSKNIGDQRWNPQADQPSSSTIEVNSMAELQSALASGANDITLKAGTYDFNSIADGLFSDGILTATSSLSLRGSGEVNVIGSIKLDAGVENFYTNGIIYDGNGNGSFLEAASGSIAISSIVVNGCEIRNYNKSIIYNNVGGSITDISFYNNIIHDFGSGQDGFDLRKGSYGTFTVQNNTLYNLVRDVFRIDLAEGAVTMSTLNVRNNTFSSTGATGKACFYVRAMVENFTVSGNLYLNQPDGVKFSRSRTKDAIAPALSNNFYFNVGENWFSGDITLEEGIANGGAVLTADPVANAAAGDFTVTDATVKAAGAGDGRWL